MKTTILVTGGAGYVGSHTIKRLLEKNYSVVMLDNFTTGKFEGSAKQYRGDIADESLVKQIVRDNNVQAVIHFAAKSLVGESMKHPDLYFVANTAKTIQFIHTLMQCGVHNIIFSSTAAVYGIPKQVPIHENDDLQPMSPYGVSKFLVEQVLESIGKQSELKWAALRYFNASGASLEGEMGEDHDPETHLIPNILKAAKNSSGFSLFGDNYSTPDGTCIRDYVHVIDLADAHICVLEGLIRGANSGAYNIGSGKGYSNLEIVNEARKITGKPIDVHMLPRREGDPDILIANPEKLKETFGWKPQYSDLQTIISSAWEWEKKK